MFNQHDKFGISFYSIVNMKAELRKKYNICFDILDLKSFKRSAPNHGWAYIIFILKDGTTFPALHFHNGGSKALLQQFGKYIHIKRYQYSYVYRVCKKYTYHIGIRARQDKLPLQFLLQISKRQPFIHRPRTRSRHVVQVFR